MRSRGSDQHARVSVVLPTYKRPDLLARAMTTVMNQSLSRWELIVVDDNGAGTVLQSETEAVVRRYADDARVVYVVHDHNRGGGAARNTGIERAKGEFVAFLDDDDAWHTDKLERQVAALDAVGDAVAMVYCRVLSADERSGHQQILRTDGESHSVEQLLERNTIGTTSSILCRTQALRAVGGFDASLPSKQDVDLYVRIAQRFAITFLDAVLVTRYLHAGDSIGKDLLGTIRAHEIFYEKYRTLIDARPVVLHRRLVSHARLLVHAGKRGEARKLLWRAWRLRPLDAETLASLLWACGVPRSVFAALAAPRKHRAQRSARTENGS